MSLSQNKATYRPDIDGLRAIAVLSVFFHHLNASLFPGGFVGVDIFFVISGFLITSQVYSEVKEGKFLFRNFYKRRINRILPALAIVSLVTLCVGLIVLSPLDLVRFVKSLLFAMIGVSNIFFWREYGNYFAAKSTEAPLLHTWSLGVEEQFYLIWPLIIMGLCRIGRPYRTGILAIMTLGGIALSEVALRIVASASYYMLPTRFFELMLGGCVALTVPNKISESTRFSNVCKLLGFILIGYSLIFLSPSSSFPGINALWPCLGAALLIVAGTNKTAASRLLASRPLVVIGLISYSLYLWHWPIIAYLHYLEIEMGVGVAIVVVAVALLLAWLSWKFVETPVRRQGNELSFSRACYRWFVIPFLGFLVITLSAVYSGGFPLRFNPLVAELEKSVQARPDQIRSLCHVPTALYKTPPNSQCRLGIEKNSVDGILVGDSYANHFTGMVDVIAKASSLSLMDYTMDGCPPILGYDTGKSALYVANCKARNEAIYAMIRSNHYRLVILAATWPRELNIGQQLMSSIEEVLKTGTKLTIILSNEGIKDANSCSIRELMYGKQKNCLGVPQGSPSYFSEVKKHYPQVHFVDPNQIICDEKKCRPMLGNTLLYRDGGHLNDIGSRLIGESLLQRGVRLLKD